MQTTKCLEGNMFQKMFLLFGDTMEKYNTTGTLIDGCAAVANNFLLKTILGIWRKEIRNNRFIEDGKRTSLVLILETKKSQNNLFYPV